MDIEERKASLFDVDSGQHLGTVDVRGDAVVAAISNNARYVAAAIQHILTDLYLFSRQQNGWSMRLLKRLQRPPRSLTWEEADDARYPPLELIVEDDAGSTTRYPLT